jgi:hypothetical protein
MLLQGFGGYTRGSADAAPRKAFARPGGKNVLSVGSSICGSLNGKPTDARGLLSGTALGVPSNSWEIPT